VLFKKIISFVENKNKQFLLFFVFYLKKKIIHPKQKSSFKKNSRVCVKMNKYFLKNCQSQRFPSLKFKFFFLSIKNQSKKKSDFGNKFTKKTLKQKDV
jgi:hypothetical protein